MPFYVRSLILCLFVCILIGLVGHSVAQDNEASRWAQADSPRTWIFPRDHGAHPEYRTEWWYFTGNLRDDKGARYGYQLTFFRQGLRLRASDPENAWSIKDLFLAHFAVTDVSARRFHWDERVSRKGPGLAGASLDGLEVWLLNWSARMDGQVIHLEAQSGEVGLDLDLKPRKPVVLHGQNGLSKKGPGKGQASYYASFTDLETRGRLRTSRSGPAFPVKGTSWFDQEFASNQLSPQQVGWDWFSLHLSDGRDLMIFFLRLEDGTTESASSGTLVESDGTTRHLDLSDIRVSVQEHWHSPRSGGKYPSRWRIQVSSAGIDLTIAPLLLDQELHTQGSTGVVYWEGAVAGDGISDGREVSCEGYAELTGYAGSMQGVF